MAEDAVVQSPGLARDSLSAMIYRKLRAGLMTGAYEPGERLNIRRLAVAFDTSPTPVREAVMQLVRDGGLELRTGHELRVPILTVERYVKVRQVRVPLERMAAELAAPIVSDKTLKTLASINDDFFKAEQQERWKAALGFNAQFHFTVYSASGNEVLLNTIENLWLLSGPFLINQYPSPLNAWDDQHPHILLIEALRIRDAAAAGDIVRRELENGSAQIIEKLRTKNMRLEG